MTHYNALLSQSFMTRFNDLFPWPTYCWVSSLVKVIVDHGIFEEFEFLEFWVWTSKHQLVEWVEIPLPQLLVDDTGLEKKKQI